MAKPAVAAAPKGRIITIDFEGVETGGGRVRIPEGDYGFRVKQIKTKKGEESGKGYLEFHLEAIKGDKKGLGKTLPHVCSLQKKALWNLRNLLESAGMKVPSKAVKIDIDKLIGKELAGTVIDDEYEGKKKSVISALFPMSDLGKTSDSGDELEEGAAEVEEEESEVEAEEEASEEEDLFS